MKTWSMCGLFCLLTCSLLFDLLQNSGLLESLHAGEKLFDTACYCLVDATHKPFSERGDSFSLRGVVLRLLVSAQTLLQRTVAAVANQSAPPPHMGECLQHAMASADNVFPQGLGNADIHHSFFSSTTISSSKTWILAFANSRTIP